MFFKKQKIDLNNYQFKTIEKCYQCGKCTAGCPVALFMDFPPQKIFRLVQLHEIEELLKSKAIWTCVSCYTCTNRCPQNVECLDIIDSLRELSKKTNSINKEVLPTYVFQESFLNTIKKFGRLNDLYLTILFKIKIFLKTLNPFLLLKDANLGPLMLLKGKLKLFHKGIKNKKILKRIFNKV